MAWDEDRGYDNSNLEQVLSRAREMIGKKLIEIDKEIRGSTEFNAENRGYAGLVIESWFVNGTNEAGPDLPDVPHPKLEHTGLEIKSVPLRRGVRKPWLVKEPMSLTMINYSDIFLSGKILPIQDSVIFSKDRWTLVIYYEIKPEDKPSGKILGIGLWDLESLDFPQIMREYVKANSVIIDGNADRLSEAMFPTGTLSARVKSSSGGLRPSGPEGKNATPRVWALKTKYIRKRLEMDGLDGDIDQYNMSERKSKGFKQKMSRMIDEKERKFYIPIPSISSNDILMIEYFQKNAVGKTVSELCSQFNYELKWNKDLHARIARLCLHNRPGGLGENGSLRAEDINGSLIKVFFVDQNLKPTEGGIRFPHVPLKEIAEEENFESSSLYGFLEHIMLLPVVRGDGDSNQQKMYNAKFLTPKYWIPKHKQLREISIEWEIFRDEIRNGKAKRLPNSRHQLPGKREMNWLHMRPSPAGGTESDLLGNECTKMCFWLNDNAVQELLTEMPVSRKNPRDEFAQR